MTANLCFVFMLIVAETRAFVFDRVIDCQVSEWSAWSEPYGFGTILRERKILRYPQNGGVPCPTNLVETTSTGKMIVNLECITSEKVQEVDYIKHDP